MSLRSINGFAYALCLIAPWSLLWLDSGMLFPYTTGKAWVFRSVVELAFALSLVLTFERARSGVPQQKSNPYSRLFIFTLCGFLLWTAICNLFGIDLYRSFWSNWERMGGFIDYMHWAMYLFSLLIVINHERSRLFLLNLTMIIVLVCVLGLLDPVKRSISTLGNPIYMGNLAVFGLFISAYLLIGTGTLSGWKRMAIRLLLLITILIAAFALIKSASRGPMLALFTGATVMLLCVGLERTKRHSKRAAGILIFGVVVSAGLLLSQAENIQQSFSQSENYALQRLGQISLTDRTTADRFENWRIALDAANSRPWMGWGQENYMIAFNQHYRPGVMDHSQLWFDRAHNAYLDVLVASGIPGLLLYCLMMLLPLWIVWKVPGWSTLGKSIITGLISAFLLKNLVGFDTFSSTLIWISLIALILNSIKAPETQTAMGLTAVRPALKYSLLALLLVTLSAVYVLNLRPYQQNRLFASLMNNPLALRSAELGEVLMLPGSRLRYAQNAKLEVFDTLLKQVATRDVNRELIAIEKARVGQVFQQAGVLVNAALRHQPHNYRIKYNGAILLARHGQYDLSIQLLEELTRASPNRTAFWHALSQIYAAQGRDKSALQASTTAANLNPDWKP